MLDKTRTRFRDTGSRPVHSTVTEIEEGTGLIAVLENGVEVVQVPGTSPANTDKFIGISFSQQSPPKTTVVVDEYHANVGSSITLAFSPTAATAVRALKGATSATEGGTAVTVGTAAATSGTIQLTGGNTINFHENDDETNYRFTYRRNLTAAEGARLTGDGYVGESPVVASGHVDYCFQGEIYTDKFESQDNWAGSNITIRVGANGLLTADGAGAEVTGGRVIALPTSDFPFLGIYLSA